MPSPTPSASESEPPSEFESPLEVQLESEADPSLGFDSATTVRLDHPPFPTERHDLAETIVDGRIPSMSPRDDR